MKNSEIIIIAAIILIGLFLISQLGNLNISHINDQSDSIQENHTEQNSQNQIVSTSENENSRKNDGNVQHENTPTNNEHKGNNT